MGDLILLFRRRRALALAAVLLIASTPACSSKKKKQAAPTPSPVPSTAAPSAVSSTPGPSPTPSVSQSTPPPPPPSPAPPKVEVPAGHPFTGGNEPIGPVVVVKVDNAHAALPQSGLDDADIIYQEGIEAGYTRLAAVYSTKRPTYVGPVRSARETDIELLAQYGKVVLAFAGANRIIYKLVKRANLVNGTYDDVLSAYRLAPGRRRPYSTFVSIPKMMAQRKGDNAKDVGFRFGSSRSPSSAATSVLVRWQSETNTVKYDRATRRWTVYIGSRRQVTVDNVIVQYVKLKRTGFTDAAGNYTPLTRTLGSGKVMLFRDGRAVDGTWHRQYMKSPTIMLDSKRQKMLLRPGTTFVMLLPNTQSISIS
ncbi:MAG: DUF3048 domain-containing protein [Mycobacteriales bacterium]